MTRYDGSQSWREYRGILATRFGIEILRQPVETWRSVRGHTLHVDVWEPDGPATGTVILVHGGGGNGRILAPFGDYIAGLGWRVLAPDLPGYGLTESATGYDGDYLEWPAVVAQMTEETDGPVVLLGFSIGGMTAAFAAEASSAVDGVIVTTLLDMGDPAVFAGAARTRWLGMLSLWGFKLMPWLIDRLSMPLALAAPLNAMSTDVDMRAYFRKDPLLGRLWVRLRFFRTLHARKMAALALPCPLLVIHPGADEWTPAALSRSALGRVSSKAEWVELTNGSHLPLERPAFEELKGRIGQFLASLAGSQSALNPV